MRVPGPVPSWSLQGTLARQKPVLVRTLEAPASRASLAHRRPSPHGQGEGRMGQTRGAAATAELPPHSGRSCSRRGRATCLGAGRGAALLAVELAAAPPHPSLPPSSPRPLRKGGICQRPVQGQRRGGRGRGGGGGWGGWRPPCRWGPSVPLRCRRQPQGTGPARERCSAVGAELWPAPVRSSTSWLPIRLQATRASLPEAPSHSLRKEGAGITASKWRFLKSL